MPKPKKNDQFVQEFASRLNEALTVHGYPQHGRQTRLANEMNVTQRSTMAWLNGLSIPDYMKLIALTNKLDISLEWLLTGKGEMVEPVPQFVPLIPWDLIKKWHELSNIGRILVKEKECAPFPIGADGFATHMKGPAMEPDIFDRDLIFVDPGKKHENNDIIFVIQDNEPKIRRVNFDGEKEYLIPSNPLFRESPLHYLNNGTIVLGVIVGQIRIF